MLQPLVLHLLHGMKTCHSYCARYGGEHGQILLCSTAAPFVLLVLLARKSCLSVALSLDWQLQACHLSARNMHAVCKHRSSRAGLCLSVHCAAAW
jgi:hypothetical protein